MRSLVAIFFAALAVFAAPASAQVLSVESWVEEWDAKTQQWVRTEAVRTLDSKDGDPLLTERGANRLAQPSVNAATSATMMVRQTPQQPPKAALAHYGPFRVVDQDHAELVDVTDRHSPTDFAEMLRAFPGITTLSMVEAPGTDDDRANLKVGRMIREAGITTHVPKGGSVRSGAVELFLAGAEKRIDDGAEFAVHSWIDAHGRQPNDFAMDAPVNRMYLDYYTEMGMTREQSRAFYAMTNSVGFSDAKWLNAKEMRGWIGADEAANDNQPPAVLPVVKQVSENAAPVIAYLDLETLLP